MAIYRGPGGSGDAVNDAASEVLLALAAKDAAIAAQVAAETAQNAAEAAQAAAELAETNAETAETNAETAETNAETAETNAETAATNAASSASAASTSASNASTSATNASNSASAASTSASNAATSATNASNSASSASTSATNASNSASAAATSATNAANSATAAQTAQTAAELAETNAETAETNAETAETNAAASASAASTSASNAASSASAASTSASNAATSATNASNSASSASTSATNASNSASAAATSASNAATSESNAATSASNAAASYDSFDDRYLGAKSSAPTLDNDGNTLLTGALYFNTVTNEMKVWSGSAWLNAYASLSGTLLASNNLSDLNNTATARTNLGVAIGTDVQAYDADLTTLGAGGSAARSFLGLAIGTDVQAYDAQLADIAGLTPADNNFIVGNGTNFVTESGSTARTSLGVAIGTDVQAYSDELQGLSQGRNLGMKNRIINGAMIIDQRNAGASLTQSTTDQFVVDRMRFNGSVTSKFTAQRSTTAPAGFINSVICTSSSAYTVGSSEVFVFGQRIEGFNVTDLNWGTADAHAITISFWVRSSLTGTFGGSLRNSAANRSYPFTYTISSANTFEKKSVTIAGDTTGTWLRDNGIGIDLTFSLGSGSTLSGTAGAWAGSNFTSATGATSVVGTNGATWYITGLQVEKGSTATGFDYRPHGTELQLAQRYYQTFNVTSDWGNGSSYAMAAGTLLTEMRATPTATYTPSAGSILGSSMSNRTYQFQIQSIGAGSASSATATFAIEL